MRYPLIFLLGPTGIGKTELSIELAFQLNAEVISADSMQIYKHMKIGTACPTKEELRGMNYHLLNFILPDRRFTVGDFKRVAEKTIDKLYKRKKNIIISGGTGLYFDSLIKGLPDLETEDFEYRQELKSIAHDKGRGYLFKQLQKEDPEYAEKIHENDLQRIIRALEVIKVTGLKYSEFQASSKEFKIKYPFLMFGLNAPREILYERINKRTDLMLKQGWLEEVQRLKELGYEENLNSMKALGYYELFKVLKGELELSEACEIIARRTRNYAKRQLTWIRKYGKTITWIERSFNTVEDTLKIIKLIKTNGG